VSLVVERSWLPGPGHRLPCRTSRWRRSRPHRAGRTWPADRGVL